MFGLYFISAVFFFIFYLFVFHILVIFRFRNSFVPCFVPYSFISGCAPYYYSWSSPLYTPSSRFHPSAPLSTLPFYRVHQCELSHRQSTYHLTSSPPLYINYLLHPSPFNSDKVQQSFTIRVVGDTSGCCCLVYCIFRIVFLLPPQTELITVSL